MLIDNCINIPKKNLPLTYKQKHISWNVIKYTHFYALVHNVRNVLHIHTYVYMCVCTSLCVHLNITLWREDE